MSHAGEAFANMGGFLFGRRTFEDFHGFWSQQNDGNPFTSIFNNTPKFVASRTLREPLPWQNSTLLSGDTVRTLKQLKSEREKDLIVFGSGELVRTLMPETLIDTYVLLIHPVVLGEGHQLFSRNVTPTNLELQHSKTTDNGVIIATYQSKG
jgi:dihydrofolate reductase